MDSMVGESSARKENEEDLAAAEACLDTNDQRTHTTMVESDIQPAADPISATNSMTIVQAETLRQMIKDFTDNFDTSMISERGKSAAEKTKADEEEEEMSYEKKEFAEYRRVWEAVWGKTCGFFEQMTALSSMQFTYYTPGCTPLNSSASTPETLQIFSIKLAEIAGGLGWPLSVYGVVAVRDVVDHNRNYIFYRYRGDSQELTQDDPFLRLIGPSRAVVYTDRINIEIQLKVKGPTESQDKALITEGRNCGQVFGPGASTYCVRNRFCNIEFCVETVRSTTQATILGVQVNNGFKWPFKYGARVACSSLRGKLVVTKDNRVTLVTDPAYGEVVMVDSKDGAKLKGADGYLHLPRSVISVEDDGRLDVDIQAYSESGVIAAKDHVSFQAKLSKITRKKCFLGGVEMVITVAWSQVPEEARIFWPY